MYVLPNGKMKQNNKKTKKKDHSYADGFPLGIAVQ
jgi:hypothetical protein